MRLLVILLIKITTKYEESLVYRSFMVSEKCVIVGHPQYGENKKKYFLLEEKRHQCTIYLRKSGNTSIIDSAALNLNQFFSSRPRTRLNAGKSRNLMNLCVIQVMVHIWIVFEHLITNRNVRN